MNNKAKLKAQAELAKKGEVSFQDVLEFCRVHESDLYKQYIEAYNELEKKQSELEETDWRSLKPLDKKKK